MFTETADWKQAFYKVIPQRKILGPKGPEIKLESTGHDSCDGELKLESTGHDSCDGELKLESTGHNSCDGESKLKSTGHDSCDGELKLESTGHSLCCGDIIKPDPNSVVDIDLVCDTKTSIIKDLTESTMKECDKSQNEILSISTT